MRTVVPLLIALTAYTPMTQLQSRHLFTMTITLHPTEELGQTPAGIAACLLFPAAISRAIGCAGLFCQLSDRTCS
jgi:hypothetical protein